MTASPTDLSLPLRHRLVGRMILLGILPTIALVAILVGINIRLDLQRAERDGERAIAHLTRVALDEMELQVDHAAIIAQTIAFAQVEGGMLGDRARTAELLSRIVTEHEELRAVSVVLDERAVAPKGALALEAVADRAPGVRDTNINVVDRGDLVSQRSYGELRRRMERGEATPILTEVVVRADGESVIQQAVPVVRAGRFLGAVLVEHPLASIEQSVRHIEESASGEVYLSDGSRLLSAGSTPGGDAGSGTDARATRVEDQTLGRLLLTRAERPGDVTTHRGMASDVGTAHLYGVSRLRHSGWTLVVRLPASTVEAQVHSALVGTVTTAAVGVTIIATMLLLLAQGVGRRLDRAVVAARRIAEGNLAEPLPPAESQDESGLLLATFERMMENLNRIVGDVRNASIQINSTATELAATSRELETTASGFGASATDVAAATRQISTTGEELLHTMQAVADSAAGTAEKAQDSRNGLRSMQTSVRRLDDAARSVAARLSTINEKALGINTIVATITKVADETNLLSVNAAIEAEKAGEFGLGFLIVAREIRRLADQTASATLDIERMIRQMQGAVSAGVSEMDRFAESLRTVLDDVDRVGNRVQGIIAHVEDDTIRFVQVTEGMRSQAAGAKQIDEAMRELSIGARQTIESAGGFGSAASDLEKAIASLKITVSSMRLRERTVAVVAGAGGERAVSET